MWELVWHRWSPVVCYTTRVTAHNVKACFSRHCPEFIRENEFEYKTVAVSRVTWTQSQWLIFHSRNTTTQSMFPLFANNLPAGHEKASWSFWVYGVVLLWRHLGSKVASNTAWETSSPPGGQDRKCEQAAEQTRSEPCWAHVLEQRYLTHMNPRNPHVLSRQSWWICRKCFILIWCEITDDLYLNNVREI